MSDDNKVVHLPKAEPDPAEFVQRQKVEAERLAGLAPGEWQLWIDGSATQLGIPRTTLEASVKAIIAEQEKAKRERKAEEERERHRAEKAAEKAAAAKKRTKERAFKALDALPEAEQGRRIAGLAADLGEDPGVVAEEFAATSSSPPIESEPELWPEAVETAKLLQDLLDQIKRFVVVQDDGAVAVALWTMFAWVHDAIATHSPMLAVTSAEPDSGKTTLLGVLARLTPRPLSGAELTGPSLFRIVDRGHPTLSIDEADDVFHRKSDLAHIINAG